jgi:hypothetical protein
VSMAARASMRAAGANGRTKLALIYDCWPFMFTWTGSGFLQPHLRARWRTRHDNIHLLLLLTQRTSTPDRFCRAT